MLKNSRISLQMCLSLLISMLVISCGKTSELPLDSYGDIQINKSIKFNQDIPIMTNVESDAMSDTLTNGDTLRLKFYLKNRQHFENLSKHGNLKYDELFKYSTSTLKDKIIEKGEIINDTAFVTIVVNPTSSIGIEERNAVFTINSHFENKIKNTYDTFFVYSYNYYVR